MPRKKPPLIDQLTAVAERAKANGTSETVFVELAAAAYRVAGTPDKAAGPARPKPEAA